ncbi:hypothetical protein FPSE5266_07099 [Fusarium pseudograminearum]|nr:hypothetical protein FPSE5266_07099 [Fusarium pseudograminearum]
MSEQLSTPRITAAYLDNFVGRVVMLVGEVTQLRGDQATVESDGTVTVLLNRDAHLSNGNYVQVIGKVNPDLSIKVLTSRDLGNSVDERFRSYQPPVSPTFSASSRRYPSRAGRRFSAADESTVPDSKSEDLELEESELFDSVLEGIGRIHVSMGRDDAGRWRIKRTTDERP